MFSASRTRPARTWTAIDHPRWATPGIQYHRTYRHLDRRSHIGDVGHPQSRSMPAALNSCPTSSGRMSNSRVPPWLLSSIACGSTRDTGQPYQPPNPLRADPIADGLQLGTDARRLVNLSG